MRKLQTKDLFNLMRIIGKANLKEEIKPVLKMAAEGKMSVEDVGIEGFLTIMEILTVRKSEQAIYEVLSGPFEMKAKEIEELGIDKLLKMLGELSKENDLKNFFTILSNMITKK